MDIIIHINIVNTLYRDKVITNSETSHLIGNVQMLANRFPDLKANTTYQQLMVQLDEIETTILERRKHTMLLYCNYPLK